MYLCVCVCVCVCRPCKSHKETDADCDCSQFPFDVAKCVNFGRDYRTHTRTQSGTHVLLAGPSSLLVVPAGIFATPLSALLLPWPPLCMKFFNAYANFAVKFCVQLVDSLTCNTDCHASLHTTPLLHTHTVAFGTTDLKGVNCALIVGTLCSCCLHYEVKCGAAPVQLIMQFLNGNKWQYRQ